MSDNWGVAVNLSGFVTHCTHFANLKHTLRLGIFSGFHWARCKARDPQIRYFSSKQTQVRRPTCKQREPRDHVTRGRETARFKMAAPMAGRNNNKTWKLLREIWINKHLTHSFRAMQLGNPLHTSSSADCGGESEVTSDGTRWWRLSGGARLAYRRRPGTRRPGVVFCPGFQSHMNGTKAEALETYCRRRGHPYVRCV